jgi:nucleoside-diphosphate-sugar epimerase
MIPNMFPLPHPASRRLAAIDTPSVFLTGATGFVGGAVAAAMAETEHFGSMLFLVRANSPAEGAERVYDSIARFMPAGRRPPVVYEHQIVIGDLGDNDTLSDARLDRITHVIHCAAVTSFAARNDIWPVNVQGTRRLARRFSNSVALQRFMYVGTAMACGTSARGPLVTESARLSPDTDHLVPYTASKASAETLLHSEFPELPLVTVRPSTVIGHTELGCAPSASLFWIVNVITMLNRFVCSPAARLDIIPVDYCAQAIVKLALKSSLRFSTYHVSAGKGGSVTVGELLEAFQGLHATRLGQGDYQQVTESELTQLVHAFVANVERVNPRVLRRALMLYGRFAQLDYMFDEIRLTGEGIPPAPSFLHYLGACHATTRHLSIRSQMAYDFK